MPLFLAVFGRTVVKNVQKIYKNIFRIPEHVWVTSKQPLLLLTTAKTQKSRFWWSKVQTSKWTTLANWERVVGTEQIREGGGLIVVFDTPFLAILAIVSRIRMNHTCYNYR